MVIHLGQPPARSLDPGWRRKACKLVGIRPRPLPVWSTKAPSGETEFFWQLPPMDPVEARQGMPGGWNTSAGTWPKVDCWMDGEGTSTRCIRPPVLAQTFVIQEEKHFALIMHHRHVTGTVRNGKQECGGFPLMSKSLKLRSIKILFLDTANSEPCNLLVFFGME